MTRLPVKAVTVATLAAALIATAISAIPAPAETAAPAGAASGTDPLRVPAFTAYLEPDQGGARISSRSGVTQWRDPGTVVKWFGQFPRGGAVDVTLATRPAPGSTTRLRLTVAGQSREITITGPAKPDGPAGPADTNAVLTTVGRFNLPGPGYHTFALASLQAPGQPAADLDALILAGQVVSGAHFNLKSRRNAASVHLGYPVARGTNVAAFYCEMTGIDDPVHTYYMACGWHRGYFGMQVNSPTERRIIFSVWDSGNEAVDRKKVADDNRVTLMAKGPGVYSGDFGNEGTGGHSHLKYGWKTGTLQRFLVTAQPTNQTSTIYSGYYFHPEQNAWMLISSWRAPKDGSWLRGLYSFSENFVGNNGQLRRKALFGNQWILNDRGEWFELTNARFSHDGTGKGDRLDRFMGVENGQFFLSHGGFSDGFTKSGDIFPRPATGRRPSVPPSMLPPNLQPAPVPAP